MLILLEFSSVNESQVIPFLDCWQVILFDVIFSVYEDAKGSPISLGVFGALHHQGQNPKAKLPFLEPLHQPKITPRTVLGQVLQ